MLPAALAPQMGTNIKFLMALKGPFWRRAELGAGLLSDGPVSMTWHGTDGQKGAGEALVAFSGGPPADACREWTADAARIENYLAELSKVYRGIRPSFVRARFMDWPSDPWIEGLVLVPRARPGHDAGADALRRRRPPALRRRVHLLRVRRLHGRRLNSGAAVAKRIAVKDGVVRRPA